MVKTTKIDVKNIVDVAILNTNLNNIQGDIAEIKASLKEINGVFASKEELAVVARQTEERFQALEKASLLWKVAIPTAATVLSGTFMFLFLNYIQHLH
ncbi:MAG: hypothetical protein ABSE17_04225 [Candidatus Levyibacteriota bacterium]|jgi:hypothetical protein